MEFISINAKEINSFYKKVSKNVKRIREERNFSQLKLTTDAEIGSNAFYSCCESSRKEYHFNLEHLYKISKILKVDICEFFI